MTDKSARPTRRAEYAEATRQAIVDAARKLFCEQGFFGTKVEDIASMARVSPATIYSVTGGKQGLLQRLMEMGTHAPIVYGTLREIKAAHDAATVVRLTAKIAREMEELSGDIMRVIVETAPHDEAAAQTCATAIERYRETLAFPARRLEELRALKPGIDMRAAIDILWFYFGFTCSRRLRQENGWSPDRANAWLTEQASHALIKSG